MKIYCCGCEKYVDALKCDGLNIYPHRSDLQHLIFYQCNKCGSYVGTHKNSGKPLGVLATKELMNARIHIHALLDPIWKSGKISRKGLYRLLSEHLEWDYHTAKIRTIKEARHIYRLIQYLKREVL